MQIMATLLYIILSALLGTATSNPYSATNQSIYRYGVRWEGSINFRFLNWFDQVISPNIFYGIEK